MLNTYWQQKSEQEKKILTVIFIMLAIIILWGCIWLPIHLKKNDLKEQVIQQQQLLALMNKQVPLIKELRSIKSQSTSKDLFSLIDTQFRNLSKTDPKLKLEESSENKVTIQFSEIPFDELIRQLVLLNKEYNVHVEECDISRLEKTGFVSGKIVLSN